MSKRILKTHIHYKEEKPWKTKDELEEFCCSYNGDDIQCKETVSPWDGYKANELDLPENSKIVVHFKARKNPCGTLHSEYDDKPKDCCEGVLPVNFPFEHNPTVMGDNSKVTLYIADGLPPFELFAEGENIHFLNSLGEEVKRIVTYNRFVTLYSDDICGTVEVVVFDECQGEATHYIRALQGQWVTVEDRRWDFYDGSPWHSDNSCSFSGTDADFPDENAVIGEWTDGTNWWKQAFHGKYLFTEYGDKNERVDQSSYEYGCGYSQNCRPREPFESGGMNVWPPCLGKHSGIDWDLCGSSNYTYCYISCSDGYNGTGCYNCPDDFRVKYDRYGAVTCGTRRLVYGGQIQRRLWQEWRC